MCVCVCRLTLHHYSLLVMHDDFSGQAEVDGGDDSLLSTLVAEAQYDMMDFSQPTQTQDKEVASSMSPPRVSKTTFGD